MSSDNIFQKTNFNGQKKFNKDPEERQGKNFTTNEQRAQKILTPAEVEGQKLTGDYPKEKTFTKEVNGELIEVTQELFRYDPLGTLIRNNDIKGQSWKYQEPIPTYAYGQCINPWGIHLKRNIFLDLDGQITEKGNTLCDECLERQEARLKLRKWMLLGLLYNPEIF